MFKFNYKFIVNFFIIFSIASAISIAQPVSVMKSQNTTQTQHKVFSEIDLVALGEKSFATFVIGEHSQSFSAKRSVLPFAINRYETTYSLWYETRIWAEEHGYSFKNPGQEGSAGKRARPPRKENTHEPVTMISWYDAVVWCNALSEKHSLTPCYTYKNEIIKDSSNVAAIDLCQCNWEADGYRLPSETEWEYAARFTGSDFQRGDLKSGQKNTNDNTEVAWTESNSNRTHTVGTAGTIFLRANAGSGNSNTIGLFDMSGNVLEFCWDWYGTYTETPELNNTGAKVGSERVSRGGSFSAYTMFDSAGDRYSYDPNTAYNYIGFRIAQSIRKK